MLCTSGGDKEQYPKSIILNSWMLLTVHVCLSECEVLFFSVASFLFHQCFVTMFPLPPTGFHQFIRTIQRVWSLWSTAFHKTLQCELCQRQQDAGPSSRLNKSGPSKKDSVVWLFGRDAWSSEEKRMRKDVWNITEGWWEFATNVNTWCHLYFSVVYWYH